jgi:hypothetical protein
MKSSLLPRSLIGLGLGAWVGLVYGLVSANINKIAILDIPIHYEFGDALSITGWALGVAAALGFLVNLPHEMFRGAVLASLAAALGVALNGVIDSLTSAERLLSALFLLTFAFLPLLVLFLPFNLFLRLSSQELLPAEGQTKWLTWPRLRNLLTWTVLAMLVGSFSLYSDNARQMMRRMNTLVLSIQSGQSEALPLALTGYRSAIKNTSSEYTISWSDDLRTYPDPVFFEDTTTSLRLNVVTVRFKSGQSLYCLFREVDRNLYLCMMLDQRPYTEYRTMAPSGFMWFPNRIFEVINRFILPRVTGKP